MGDEPDAGRTRRQFVAVGAGLVGGGLLAGCVGGDSRSADGGGTAAGTDTDSPPDGTAETAPVETAPSADASTTDPPSRTAGGPYAAEMAPTGEVTFDEPPESIFTVMSSHADMALALGRGDDVNAVYAVEYTNSLVNAFTPRLEGVSVDWSDLVSSWDPSKETVYELDSDVHLADPAKVLTMDSWDEGDVREVAEQVGPWFGNSFSAERGEPPAAYADDYRYYSLWETFGRVASALREEDRYEALAAVRDDLVSTVEAGLPPADERPSVAMVLPSTSDGSTWTYDVTAEGYHSAHTRPLGTVDAFDGVADHGANVDYEALAEADPDVLLVLGGVVDAHDMAAIRETLADDPVASRVTAVDEGRVHAQGTRHQGPLINLFQLEMGAKQCYPEQFGEWPAYVEGPYPELSAEAQLFDHERVAETITDKP